MRRVSDTDRDALRGYLPEVLRTRCGVENVNRPFRCPLPDHDDRTPSARYYANGHTVHCFGCGRTVDVFTLVGLLDGIEGFPEQVEAVADLVGYRLNGDPGARPAKKVESPAKRAPFDEPRPAGGDDVSEACMAAYDNFFAPGLEVGRRYLRYRGLDDHDLIEYGLGFCLDPRTVMPQFRVYEPDALGYIVIPFWNQDFSEARYVMMRTVSRRPPRNKEWRPKGIVTPLWREWMLSAGLPVVYVTEGIVDAMALAKISGRQVMALGGTSNAKRLAQVLCHTREDLRPRRIVVAMDEDVAGRKARDQICRDLDAIGVRHSNLPAYPNGCKDADEWLMGMRDVEWTYEERRFGLAPELAFYYTRWRDGR